MMKAKKFLRCPDCRKSFEKIKNLNMHIAKTGHNDKKQIDVLQFWNPFPFKIKTDNGTFTMSEKVAMTLCKDN